MRQVALTAAALVVGMVAGWALRGSRPPVVEYRDREVRVDARADSAVEAVEPKLTRVINVGEVRVVRRRTESRPDGTRVEESTDVTREPVSDRAEASAERVRTVTKTETVYRDRERIVRETPPRWSLGLGAALSMSEPARPIPAATAAVRVLGPVWLRGVAQVPVDSPGSATGALLLEVTW